MNKTVFCHSLGDIDSVNENEEHIVCDFPYIYAWTCVRCGRLQDERTPRFFPAYNSGAVSYAGHCPHCAESIK